MMAKYAVNYVVMLCVAYGVKADHGWQHAIWVASCAVKSLCRDFSSLCKEKKLAVFLAAMFHDIDDRKIFPHNEELQNARRFLVWAVHVGGVSETTADDVITMINLVSFSKNGNRVDRSHMPWMYIPRDCDRLSAGGMVGITRTLKFNLHNTQFGCCPLTQEGDYALLSKHGISIETLTGYDLRGVATTLRESSTDRSSMVRFFLTDWIRRGECASGSKWLKNQFAIEFDVLADWFAELLQLRATRTVWQELSVEQQHKQAENLLRKMKV